MPDYQNGKIYKLVNSVNDIVYIGSTTIKLYDRISGHRMSARAPELANGIYPAMRNLGVKKFNIVLIKTYPCDSRSELEKMEYRIIQRYKRHNIELYNINGGKGKDSHMYGRTGHKGNHFKRGCVSFDNDKLSPCWAFKWQVDKRTRKRSFAVSKYGFEEAKILAEQMRDEIYPIEE